MDTEQGHTVGDAAATAVYDALARLGIDYDVHQHAPVFTVEEALVQWASIDAAHCKNLFLRNKKGTRHYLIVALHTTPVDLRALAARVGDDRLSFGSADRLARYLGLTPGSVSPFGLLNDTAHEVRVIVDASLRQATRIGVHPNVNTATIVLSARDLERFLDWTGNPVQFLEL
jgi:Ala-tRNA(Pro) deacylase